MRDYDVPRVVFFRGYRWNYKAKKMLFYWSVCRSRIQTIGAAILCLQTQGNFHYEWQTTETFSFYSTMNAPVSLVFSHNNCIPRWGITRWNHSSKGLYQHTWRRSIPASTELWIYHVNTYTQDTARWLWGLPIPIYGNGTLHQYYHNHEILQHISTLRWWWHVYS